MMSPIRWIYSLGQVLTLVFMAAPACVAVTELPDVHELVAESALAIDAENQGQATTYDALDNAVKTEQSIWLILFYAFLAGVLTSFMPCLYPMIPITVGVLQAQAAHSLIRQFAHACSYVLGIATIYAGLGCLVASSSMIFGQWMSNPWIVGFMVLFFVYLAGSMFGWYELRFGGLISPQLAQSKSHSLFSTYLFGLITGTVGSPCLTPALVVLLSYASKAANPIVGFAALFSFSLGMSTLLLIIGFFSGALAYLPRAGEWMEEVKRFFGFGMIGSALFLLEPFIGLRAVSLLAALGALVATFYFCYSARAFWHDENTHLKSLKTNPIHVGERFRLRTFSAHIMVTVALAAGSMVAVAIFIAQAA